MKRVLILGFLGLLSFSVFSQKKIIYTSKGIDSSFSKRITIPAFEIPKSYPNAIYSTVDSLLFKLDSLARPFYNVEKDSNGISYKNKYRIYLDKITGDTSYIPLPKKQQFITVEQKLELEPIRVKKPIEFVNIDTLKKAPDPVWWAYKNSFAFDISEAAFVNWNAGGNNSISGLIKLSFERDYKKIYTLWKNEVKIRYGLNSQEDRELRKTDDQININSTFGYRTDTISNWYYSAKFNFRTQFTDGFSYPNIEVPISRFLSPAYLFLGLGAQYELKKDQFSVYLSPITLKSTFVRDQRLSNEGAFGVEKGKHSRNEFGFLIQTSWDFEVFKNVVMKNDLSLYSDYLRKFGNTDIRYDLAFEFVINKIFKANLGAHLIYDDDIKFKEDVNGDGQLETLGPRLQLKQLLGIGVAFNF